MNKFNWCLIGCMAVVHLSAQDPARSAMQPAPQTTIMHSVHTRVKTSSHAMAPSPLQVMTFNIRLKTSSDSLNGWEYRKGNVVSEILYHQVSLLGVQEATPDQMVDLRASLKQYRSLGGGREDGKNKGEFSAIFYDTVRLTSVASGMFWLSQTPEIPGSIGWDAKITRMVTWSRFRDNKSGKIFYAFNTHFDHIGPEARRQSAAFLLKQVQVIAGKLPAVITGDFNSKPADEPIRIILNAADSIRVTDTKALSETGHYGPTGTFNGWAAKERDDDPIDYIFVKGDWEVKRHASISQTWAGRFASDHFAVLAELVL